MAFLKKKNCARSTINQVGGINSIVSSVIVADGSEFPATGDFLVTIWDKGSFPNPCDDTNNEIVKVTSRTGNTLTIERGQEDTTGVIHSNGQAVEMLVTAGTFEELETEINSLSPGQSVWSELPTQPNGSLTTFTTAFNYVAGTLRVYVGGQRQTPGGGADYTETGANTFELNYTPVTGERLIVDYIKV